MYKMSVQFYSAHKSFYLIKLYKYTKYTNTQNIQIQIQIIHINQIFIYEQSFLRATIHF